MFASRPTRVPELLPALSRSTGMREAFDMPGTPIRLWLRGRARTRMRRARSSGRRMTARFSLPYCIAIHPAILAPKRPDAECGAATLNHCSRNPDRRRPDPVNGLLAMSELAVVSSRPARLKVHGRRRQQGRRGRTAAGRGSRQVPVVGADRHHPGRRAVGRLLGRDAGRPAGRLPGSTGVPNRRGRRRSASASWSSSSPIFSLIVGELVPKQIALRDPEGDRRRASRRHGVIATVAAPLVCLLDISGRAVLRAARPARRERGAGHRRGDQDAGRRGREHGVLESDERRMIAGVMRLGDRAVRAVMTPRTEVDWIDLSDPHEEIIAQAADGHAAFAAAGAATARSTPWSA